MTPREWTDRGYSLVVYEWDPTTGLARLRYERTIAGMVEHEFDQVHHGRCYVPANVRSRL